MCKRFASTYNVNYDTSDTSDLTNPATIQFSVFGNKSKVCNIVEINCVTYILEKNILLVENFTF